MLQHRAWEGVNLAERDRLPSERMPCRRRRFNPAAYADIFQNRRSLQSPRPQSLRKALAILSTRSLAPLGEIVIFVGRSMPADTCSSMASASPTLEGAASTIGHVIRTAGCFLPVSGFPISLPFSLLTIHYSLLTTRFTAWHRLNFFPLPHGHGALRPMCAMRFNWPPAIR